MGSSGSKEYSPTNSVEASQMNQEEKIGLMDNKILLPTQAEDNSKNNTVVEAGKQPVQAAAKLAVPLKDVQQSPQEPVVPNKKIAKLFGFFESSVYNDLIENKLNPNHYIWYMFFVLFLIFLNILLPIYFLGRFLQDSLKYQGIKNPINKRSVDYNATVSIPKKNCKNSWNIISCESNAIYAFRLLIIVPSLMVFSAFLFMAFVISSEGREVDSLKTAATFIVIYATISSFITIAYVQKLSKSKVTGPSEKYDDFNNELRKHMYMANARFTSALKVAPTNAFDRDKIVNNALDQIIQLSSSERAKPLCTDGLATAPSVPSPSSTAPPCRDYNTMNAEEIGKIIVTLNMYNYYSKISDPDDRAEALNYVFDSMNVLNQNIPENPALSYSHYLSRYTTSIPQDDAITRYSKHPVFYLPSSTKTAALEYANKAMSELNKIASVMYPEKSYKDVQNTYIGLFMAQIGLPVLIIIVYRKIQSRMAEK
jgi:hypothetical protein